MVEGMEDQKESYKRCWIKHFRSWSRLVLFSPWFFLRLFCYFPHVLPCSPVGSHLAHPGTRIWSWGSKWPDPVGQRCSGPAMSFLIIMSPEWRILLGELLTQAFDLESRDPQPEICEVMRCQPPAASTTSLSPQTLLEPKLVLALLLVYCF